MIPDVQSYEERRNISVGRVGIKSLRYPIIFEDDPCEPLQHVVANCEMSVRLSGYCRGTHMSRFIQVLENFTFPLSLSNFPNMLHDTADRLRSDVSEVAISFPFFVDKFAPVSQAKSVMDYSVVVHGVFKRGEKDRIGLRIKVPVAMVCPCSKAISAYGAHNQRSVVCLSVILRDQVRIKEIIKIAEEHSSCPLYGLLKRPDEKYVTEYAYDNPKFVEDLVRDIAICMNEDDRIEEYCVESENFESIHNHSVYARIES